MSSDFADVVEVVKKMSSEDKEEIKFLIERYLIEEQREEIYKNYKASFKEFHENKLSFSNDIDKLKGMMDEW